jgi:hypothetical protein
MVPENVPRIMFGIPEKLMLPVTFDPFCVSCHVIVPMVAWPIIPPAPSVAVLESTAVPVQVPLADATDPAIVGELPPQPVAPAISPNSAAIMSPLVMIHPLLPHRCNPWNRHALHQTRISRLASVSVIFLNCARRNGRLPWHGRAKPE